MAKDSNGQTLAQAILRPRSVALIGASGDPAKNTSRPQRFLKAHGYRGRVFPINPSRDEVLGEPAYASLSAVPELIDHALIMVPPQAAIAAVAECARAGVAVATLFSDGFAETGEAGQRLQDELVATARRGGVRLIGPNSIGVINLSAGLALTANAALEDDTLRAGRYGVVSHSGSLLGMLISRGHARGIGFSSMISLGNEADIDVADGVEALIGDAATEVILLYLETVRAPERLSRALHRAHAAGKPVIAYKLGRSAAGRELTVSHTGAIAGSDAMIDGFLRAHGVLRVDMAETLFELPPLVAGRTPLARGRVAVMSTTGGGGAMVVDRLGVLGVDVVAPPAAMIERLAAKGITIGAGRLTDLTLAGTRHEVYAAVLNELLASPHCDAVVAVVGTSAQFHPQHAVRPILDAAPTEKPLAVFLTPQADASLGLLAEAGIAAFRTPESCADAVCALTQWRPPQVHPEQPPATLTSVNALLANCGGRLSEAEAGAAFAALGIRQPAHQILDDLENLESARSTMGYPLAAKILSADIVHKTEAGGVVLNIVDDDGLRAAAAAMLIRVRAAHPKARLDGILLQPMESGRAEVLIGFRRDPQAGPAVVLGMGGTLAEIYEDFALRLAPVTAADAREMIDEVRGLAILRGYRALPPGDLDALADAVAALSWLCAATPEIAEAEINPLLVKAPGEGVVAVDGLIVLAADRIKTP